MKLNNVKFQDSCIYIELSSSQGEHDGRPLLERVKNVYVSYKIIAFGNYIKDTILIKEQDITRSKGVLILKFELNQLHHPERSKIEIIQLKFNFIDGESEILPIERVSSFLDIREPNISLPIPPKKEKKDSVKKQVSPTFVKEEIVTPKTSVKPIQVVIEDSYPVSKVVSDIKSAVSQKLDAQTKNLEMDISKLCFKTIDLLLTILPQPVLTEEYRASNSMIESILASLKKRADRSCLNGIQAMGN